MSASVVTPSNPGRFDHAWRALRHRNFRLYAAGQGVSLMGTWMTRLALSWLTYRLTNSALLLGLVGFSGQILSFAFAPFSGVWVDRLDRRKLLIWTQVASAAQSLTLAWLTLSGRVTIGDIFVLATLQGLFEAFDMPARQSFMVKMVGDNRADLSNAIALNSSIVNLARLIGPPTAAFVIARLNEGYCFLIDGLSYFAVIASLLAMRVHHERSSAHRTSMLEQMLDGWSYVRTYIPVRNLLLLFSISNLIGLPYTVLLPVFTTQVFHGGPHTLGLLSGASGIGSLTAALMLAARKSVVGLVTMIQISWALFGLSIMAFGVSRVFWFSMAMMMLAGFGMMQGLAASNTVIQTLAPEEKRGRVMAFYTMGFVGMTPFGSLITGWLAHTFGAPHTLLITGAIVVVASLWFWSQRKAVRTAMRPRYEELGILEALPPQ